MAITASTPSADTTALTAAWQPTAEGTRIPDGSQTAQDLAVGRGDKNAYLDDQATAASRRGGLQNASSSASSTASTGTSNTAEWVSRFQNWSMLGEAQATVAETQASEVALVQTYRQLNQLKSQLGQDSTQVDALSQRLQQLDQSLQQQSSLDNQLQPTVWADSGSTQSYVLDKVDLVSAKPANEQVRIYFPSSRSGATVALPAGSSGQTVAESLGQALQKEGIQVTYNESGQLSFSASEGNERKLSEPMLMSGQGVRVPAGNAVTVRLSAEKGTLSQLADQVASADSSQQRQQVQQQIQQLQQQIQQTVQQLRTYRQQVQQQAEQQSRAMESDLSQAELVQSQRQLQLALGQTDYQSIASTLQAQANVTSQTVVALLA
jgi:regulator of replication initiation timing